nr:MAG TPA: hypothetical protein [Caudoviricetes sp.]
MTDEELEERYYCENYRRRNCKHFRSVIRSNPSTGCHHRIDHHHVCYGGAIFSSAPEELAFPCRDFEPDDLHIHGKSIWECYDDWLSKWLIYWNGRKPLRQFMLFYLDGNREVGYLAKTYDWINGTLFDEAGNHKWVYRSRLKRVRDGYGYKRIWAKPENGQWVLCERETLFSG